MDSRDHYITKFVVSKPLMMGKLASHDHKRHKTRIRNKENGEHWKRRAPKVISSSKQMP